MRFYVCTLSDTTRAMIGIDMEHIVRRPTIYVDDDVDGQPDAVTDVHSGVITKQNGALGQIERELWNLKCKDICIVSDPGVVAQGYVACVEDAFHAQKIRTHLFCDVKPCPTIANVRAGVKFLRTSQAHAVVAVGGGSVIDAAKAIHLAYANTQFAKIANLQGFPYTTKRVPFFAAIPTTFTPAACTGAYVLLDQRAQSHVAGFDAHAIPDAVGVVPSFLHMPKPLAAQTLAEVLISLFDICMSYVCRNHVQLSFTDRVYVHAAEALMKDMASCISDLSRRNFDSDAFDAYAKDIEEISVCAADLCNQTYTCIEAHVLESVAHAMQHYRHVSYGFACSYICQHLKNCAHSDVCAPATLDAISNLSDAMKHMPAQHIEMTWSEDDTKALCQIAQAYRASQRGMRIPQRGETTMHSEKDAYSGAEVFHSRTNETQSDNSSKYIALLIRDLLR